MEELIKNMIHDLQKQVEEKVPPEGDFPEVHEQHENPDKRLRLSHLILKVTPVRLEGGENKRFLELAVMNLPYPYICEKVVGYGTKQEILDKLADEGLVQRIVDSIPEMEIDFY